MDGAGSRMIGVWVMMRWFVDRLLLFCLILLSVLMMNYCLGPQDRGFCEWLPFCYSEVMTNESNVTAAKAACDTKRKQNMDANPDDRWMHSWPRWYAPDQFSSHGCVAKCLGSQRSDTETIDDRNDLVHL